MTLIFNLCILIWILVNREEIKGFREIKLVDLNIGHIIDICLFILIILCVNWPCSLNGKKQ